MTSSPSRQCVTPGCTNTTTHIICAKCETKARILVNRLTRP